MPRIRRYTYFPTSACCSCHFPWTPLGFTYLVLRSHGQSATVASAATQNYTLHRYGSSSARLKLCASLGFPNTYICKLHKPPYSFVRKHQNPHDVVYVNQFLSFSFYSVMLLSYSCITYVWIYTNWFKKLCNLWKWLVINVQKLLSPSIFVIWWFSSIAS